MENELSARALWMFGFGARQMIAMSKAASKFLFCFIAP